MEPRPPALGAQGLSPSPAFQDTSQWAVREKPHSGKILCSFMPKGFQDALLLHCTRKQEDALLLEGNPLHPGLSQKSLWHQS